MDVEGIQKAYGINPNEIGRDNRGWTITNGMLVIITKDTDKFQKMDAAVDKWMRSGYKNFLWVSCDILDKRILYYWYCRLDTTQSEVTEMYKTIGGDKKWK